MAGLRDTAAAAVQTAFTAAVDFLTSVSILEITEIYDTATGTATETTTTHSVDVLVESYSSHELATLPVQRNDVKMTFPCADLAVTPLVGWRVTYDSKRCEIIAVENPDGNQLVWTLQVRIP